ncbi:hypothetical protein, partial [Actinocorallia libanotica]
AKTVSLPTGKGSLTCTAWLPDQVTSPHFFIAEYTQDYDKTFGGLDVVEFTARILIARGDERSAQEVLDLLLRRGGPSSLKCALEAARGEPGEYALGGLADDFRVERMQGNRLYEHAGVQYVGGELIIRVFGSEK